MRSFAARSNELEEMEAPGLEQGALTRCLEDLARANTLTLARPPTLRGSPPGSAFSLLDVGYGQGDMLRAIRRWAVRRGFSPRLAGIDLSPWSATAASAATDPAWGIAFLTGDVFELPGSQPFDYVVSSLVAHHMSDETVVRFVRWMEANARLGWFINDLHRHPIAYYGFMAISNATGLDRMVRHDGLISVARAFTSRDWRRLLRSAGLAPGDAQVAWRFPFRICVGRLK